LQEPFHIHAGQNVPWCYGNALAGEQISTSAFPVKKKKILKFEVLRLNSNEYPQQNTVRGNFNGQNNSM
jgi:hypothetical protein